MADAEPFGPSPKQMDQAVGMMKAADAMARALRACWAEHTALLQECANLTGWQIPQAIPGLPDILPEWGRTCPARLVSPSEAGNVFTGGDAPGVKLRAIKA